MPQSFITQLTNCQLTRISKVSNSFTVYAPVDQYRMLVHTTPWNFKICNSIAYDTQTAELIFNFTDPDITVIPVDDLDELNLQLDLVHYSDLKFDSINRYKQSSGYKL